MKVYRLGNDYAHQSKKNEVNNPVEVLPPPLEKMTAPTETKDAGNEIPTGGEGEVVSKPEESPAPKKAKGKKEARPESIQQD